MLSQLPLADIKRIQARLARSTASRAHRIQGAEEVLEFGSLFKRSLLRKAGLSRWHVDKEMAK